MLCVLKINFNCLNAELSLGCSPELPFFGAGAIFFCMVGLPLFGKVGSETIVFKILVRALSMRRLF